MNELPTEVLKAKLTPEEYTGVIAAFKAVARREYSRGFAANGWSPMLKGMAKSVTAWLGWFLVAYPLLEPQLTPFLTQLVGPQAHALFVSAMGVLVIAARMKTKESLEAKGAPRDA